MKSQLASSQRVKVRVIEYEDSDIAALVAAGKISELTTAINADRRQKVALVDFRADLSEKITALSFARKVEQITKDGKTEETHGETEGDHIGRFVDALALGTLTLPDFTLPSGDDKVKETAALAYLQKLAFTCGDKKDSDGNPCYELDVNRPVSTSAGKNLIPKWAMEAASNIIKNGSQDKWVTNFTSGYTSASGVAIDPIVFEDFKQVAPDGSTPEAIQGVLDLNIKNLAKAIKAVRAQEDAKRAPEFV